MEALFMEKATVKAVTGPIDLDAGANTGGRIDMQKFKRCTFIIVAAAGTTPSSHTASFQQHDAVSAGNSASLSLALPWFHKVDTATVYTKVEPTVAAASFDIDSVVGDTKFVAVFEVKQEEIDMALGRWISCNVTDAGGAQIGTVIAIPHEPVFYPAYPIAV